MMPEEYYNKKYDEAIVSIFRAGGMIAPHGIDAMRQAVRKIMVDAYIDGSNDCAMALKNVPPPHPL